MVITMYSSRSLSTLVGKSEWEDTILFLMATLQQQIAYRSKMRGSPGASDASLVMSVLQPKVWQTTALLELSSSELSLDCKAYLWHYSSNQTVNELSTVSGTQARQACLDERKITGLLSTRRTKNAPSSSLYRVFMIRALILHFTTFA